MSSGLFPSTYRTENIALTFFAHPHNMSHFIARSLQSKTRNSRINVFFDSNRSTKNAYEIHLWIATTSITNSQHILWIAMSSIRSHHTCHNICFSHFLAKSQSSRTHETDQDSIEFHVCLSEKVYSLPRCHPTNWKMSIINLIFVVRRPRYISHDPASSSRLYEIWRLKSAAPHARCRMLQKRLLLLRLTQPNAEKMSEQRKSVCVHMRLL